MSLPTISEAVDELLSWHLAGALHEPIPGFFDIWPIEEIEKEILARTIALQKLQILILRDREKNGCSEI